MRETETTADPLTLLTNALVDWCSCSTQIVAHMMRSSAPPPRDEEITRTLRRLVGETLEPLRDRHPDADLHAGAELTVDAVHTLEQEILLVNPEPPRPAARRMRRRRRRP